MQSARPRLAMTALTRGEEDHPTPSMFSSPFHLSKPVTFSMAAKPKLNVQKFPRPPLLERTNRNLQIKWAGETVVDSPPNESYWVLETTVCLLCMMVVAVSCETLFYPECPIDVEFSSL